MNTVAHLRDSTNCCAEQENIITEAMLFICLFVFLFAVPRSKTKATITKSLTEASACVCLATPQPRSQGISLEGRRSPGEKLWERGWLRPAK